MDSSLECPHRHKVHASAEELREMLRIECSCKGDKTGSHPYTIGVKGEGGAMIERVRIWRSGSFVVACVCTVLVWAMNSHAQETMRFDSEAKKLEFIRKALKKEEYMKLDEVESKRSDREEMMKDLLVNRRFKAIEPIVRANSKEDPKLAKWKRCEKLDYKDMGVEPESFYDGLDRLGVPPYRYYRIDFDSDSKNGLEDVVYHNGPGKGSPMGTTGYTWVDLDRCEMMDHLYATGAGTMKSRKKGAAYLNTLVQYKGNLWLLDYVEGHYLKLLRRIDPERIETCLWFFFKAE
jgi:hypothetical protein